MSDRFDKLTAEARAELGNDAVRRLDWDEVDAKLFARIDCERRAQRDRFAPPRRRGLALAGVGLAVAVAVVALLAGKTREPFGAEDTAALDGAGSVVAIEGSGALLDGKPVAGGAALRLGDVLETGSAQVTVARPGRLMLTLEAGSRTVVAHVQGALVLALEQGAIEAQVVPVAAGEAFAVDVGAARVAVHGTHLRVARQGDRVVVDLSEGVVSIGDAPRAGSVLGTLVNAPAHVEFMATDPAATLRQTHDPAAVRAAERPPQGTASLSAPSQRPAASTWRAPPAETVPAGSPGEGHPESRSPSAANAKPASMSPEPTPEEAISSAVRRCMAERPRADNVTVVVNTTLRLELADDGTVRFARFDPPVAPDVNACSTGAIYREHFGRNGTVTVAIPIDFTN
jgi:ferric-dicitrate binding protein FerR (iron transport regulator)